MHQLIIDSVNRCYPLGYSSNPFFSCKKRLNLPCLNNALLFTKYVDDSVYTNTIEGEDDAEIRSNAVYLDGVLPSTTQFINDILSVDELEIVIYHSSDNVTWTETILAATETSNLFSIDEVNRTLSIGSIAQYYSRVYLRYNDTLEVVWDVLNASNSDEEDTIVSVKQLESQFSRGKILSNIRLLSNLKIYSA